MLVLLCATLDNGRFEGFLSELKNKIAFSCSSHTLIKLDELSADGFLLIETKEKRADPRTQAQRSYWIKLIITEKGKEAAKAHGAG